MSSILPTVGVIIEGVGSDPAKTSGLSFCYGAVPTVGTYQWWSRLISRPSSIADSINPFTGQLQTSSFSFELSNTDDVATRLLYVQSKTDLYITSSISAAATTVSVTGTGSLTLTGSVVWVGDEAILLGTHAGSGMYNSCTRGIWSTTAQSHDADEWAYTKNPYLRERRVTLVTHDRDTGTEVIRWRGYLEASGTSDDGLRVQLQCRAALTQLKSVKVNRGAPRLKLPGAQLSVVEGAGTEPGVIVFGAADVSEPRFDKAQTSHTMALQVGDTLVTGNWANGTTWLSGFPVREWGAPAFDGDDPVLDEEDVYEVFCIFGGRSSASSATRNLTKWRHPFALAYAMMVSTDSTTPSGFDALSGPISANAPPEWFDETAIQARIDEDPDLEMDQLLLGWDGDEVDLFDFTQQTLLMPFGASWVLTDDGLISIGRFHVVGIDEYSSTALVQPLPHRLKQDGTRDNEYQQVIGEFGALPWRRADQLIVESRDGRRRDSTRRTLFPGKSSMVIDYQTLAPARKDDESRLITRSVRGYYGMPTIHIKALDYVDVGTSYDLLGAITLGDPGIVQAWFLSNDGVRVTLTAPDPSFVGRIVSRRYDFRTNTYDLGVLLTNFRFDSFPLYRAPTAELNGAGSGTTLTVHQNRFHASANDTSYFEVGDIVELWYRDGVKCNAAERRTVQSVTATTIVVNTAFTTKPDGAVVRLTDYDNYGVGGHPSRIYAFQADATGIFGFSGDTGDIYG